MRGLCLILVTAILQAYFAQTTAPSVGQDAKVSATDVEIPNNAKGCEASWRKLLQLDINSDNVPGVQFLQNVVIKADTAGYVLIKPAYSVNRYINGHVLWNQYSFWAYFECQDGVLVHQHCRFGTSDEKWMLKIPVDKFFVPDSDPLAKEDYMVYACIASNVKWLSALVYPCASYTELHLANVFRCKRPDGSQWCGAPQEIEKNGCLSDWLSLQKGQRINWSDEGNGRIIFEKNEVSMQIKLICENAKLQAEECFLNKKLPKIPPGHFTTHEGFFFGCPKAGGYSAKQLKNAVVMMKAAPGLLPRELKGFKTSLPSNLDPACKDDWAVLTQNGIRRSDEETYVEIAPQLVIPDKSQPSDFFATKVSAVWALFTCTKETGKLTLDHCRQGDKGQKISPGKFQKKDYRSNGMFYFNCGETVDKKTAAVNVEAVVTRTKNAAVVGLEEA